MGANPGNPAKARSRDFHNPEFGEALCKSNNIQVLKAVKVFFDGEPD
jgi:hypothetical protein